MFRPCSMSARHVIPPAGTGRHDRLIEDGHVPRRALTRRHEPGCAGTGRQISLSGSNPGGSSLNLERSLGFFQNRVLRLQDVSKSLLASGEAATGRGPASALLGFLDAPVLAGGLLG